MRKKIKLMATDFDGTILKGGVFANEIDVPAILKLQEKGVKVIGVTGQPYNTAIRTAKGFSGDKFFDLIVSDNGAYISPITKNEPILSVEIDIELVKKFDLDLGNVKTNSVLCFSGRNKNIYVGQNTDGNELVQTVWFKGYEIKSINDLMETDIVNQICISCKKEDNDKVQSYLHNYKDQLTWAVDSHEDYFNYLITSIFANKGTAINFISDKFNIGKDEIIVFGDGTNDIPMFKAAGHSVAPSNAAKEIKEIAGYLTDSVSEGGIGNFINKNLI